MTIPALDHRGLLPAGRHDCEDWATLAAAFAQNEARSKLLNRALECIREKLEPAGAGLELIVGGSFVTDKVDPDDIDLTILLPVSELSSRGVLMQLFAEEGAKGLMWDKYKVEFYISLLGLSCNNLALYFEYVGPKTGEAKSLNPKDKRGTVRVKKWTLG